ncbi:MAG TPA: BPSS1780 family membrane protein [Burkholderiaceae bacterium]|nr:BPSS1780 family membrane protein [Burkholderiaceae bacterium]
MPATRGVAWVGRAFGLLSRRPLGFTMLFVAFIFAALMLALLPWIGGVLVLAAIPLLTLGFVNAADAAQRGEAVRLVHLIEPLLPAAERTARRRLLGLCLLFAVLAGIVMLLAQGVDGGRFERLQTLWVGERTAATRQEIDALLADPRLANGLMLRFGLLALLSVPFWHAPMLVAWHRQGVAQALFSSTLALWHQRGAYLMYGLAWAAASTGLGIVVALLAAFVGASVMALVMPPAALLLSVAFYVSLHFCYVDAFAPMDPAAPGTPPQTA